MVIAIKKEGEEEARLALVLPQYDCVEHIETLRHDLVEFIGVAGQNADIPLECYIGSLMDIVNLLEVDIKNSWQADKELKDNAILIPKPPTKKK